MIFQKSFEELLKYNQPIGIKLTSKFDASLVFYLLAKTIDLNKKYSVELYPFTVGYKKNKIHILKSIKQIHLFVKNSFPNVIIKDIKYFNYDYPDCIKYSRNQWIFWGFAKKEMYEQYGINICLDGRSRNFPLSILLRNQYKNRHLEKDFDFSKEPQNYTQYDSPFCNITRKEIAKIYQDLNLMNTLLPLTRICEMDPSCEMCDWCKTFRISFGATFSEYIQNVHDKNHTHT